MSRTRERRCKPREREGGCGTSYLHFLDAWVQLALPEVRPCHDRGCFSPAESPSTSLFTALTNITAGVKSRAGSQETRSEGRGRTISEPVGIPRALTVVSYLVLPLPLPFMPPLLFLGSSSSSAITSIPNRMLPVHNPRTTCS